MTQGLDAVTDIALQDYSICMNTLNRLMTSLLKCLRPEGEKKIYLMRIITSAFAEPDFLAIVTARFG